LGGGGSEGDFWFYIRKGNEWKRKCEKKEACFWNDRFQGGTGGKAIKNGGKLIYLGIRRRLKGVDDNGTRKMVKNLGKEVTKSSMNKMMEARDRQTYETIKRKNQKNFYFTWGLGDLGGHHN